MIAKHWLFESLLILALPTLGETVKLQELNAKLIDIQKSLGTILKVPQPVCMVPFAVETKGGLCDSIATAAGSHPKIIINGQSMKRSSNFVVTSVLVKTAIQQQVEDYIYVSVDSVRIDGTLFDTRTGNIFAPVDVANPVNDRQVQESADLMGMAVRIGNLERLDVPIDDRKESEGGANFPHQIVATPGSPQQNEDIVITLFCQANKDDLNIELVRVSGWRRPGDSVVVTYQYSP